MSTDLIDAIRVCDVASVCSCLLTGANPNFIEDHEGVTPLHHAAQFDSCEIVEILVLAGADIFSETFSEELTPLEVACMHENWHVAALLAHYQQYLYLLCRFAYYYWLYQK